MNDINRETQKAYKKLKEIIKEIPVDLSKFDYFIDNIKKKENLFITFAGIIPYIANKENVKLDNAVITDYQVLSMLIFIAYTNYDKVFDEKDTKVLSNANMLFREFVKLACRLDINIDKAHNITEKYNQSPNILNVGKIVIDNALKMDEVFYRVTDGFEVATVIVKDFAEKFIKNPVINWEAFWRAYLLDRQFSDDMLDYQEDLFNNQLKSFGILAITNRYKGKRTINLKNPITFITFQSWIANNMKNLEKTYVNKYYNYIEKCNLDLELFNSLKNDLSQKV